MLQAAGGCAFGKPDATAGNTRSDNVDKARRNGKRRPNARGVLGGDSRQPQETLSPEEPPDGGSKQAGKPKRRKPLKRRKAFARVFRGSGSPDIMEVYSTHGTYSRRRPAQ